MNTDALENNPYISRQALSEIHEDLFRWARTLAGDRAEDVLQQSYVLILEGRAKYEQQATLKTWAFGVVKNVSRQSVRTTLRRQMREVRWLRSTSENQPEVVESAQFTGQRDQQAEQVKHAIRALPARQREVLELHSYREFSLEECAQILKLSVGSVRTHYHRAKTTLRRELTEQR